MAFYSINVWTNGLICDREWLMYSIKQGSVYCFMCKLFSRRFHFPFVSNGFDKWKNYEKITQHENNTEHRIVVTMWFYV